MGSALLAVSVEEALEEEWLAVTVFWFTTLETVPLYALWANPVSAVNGVVVAVLVGVGQYPLEYREEISEELRTRL